MRRTFTPFIKAYTKTYLSLPEQLKLLKSRGMQVANDAVAIESLHRNGYYRLSAYWYPFRETVAGKHIDTFLSDSHFGNVIELYKFDKKLRLLLLDAIERVEIAARVEISLVLGKIDPFAHTKSILFRPRFSQPNANGDIEYQEWIKKFNYLYKHSSAEFIVHHKEQYGWRSPLPIWIAVELWDFGMLSKAFSNMQHRDQVAFVNRFSVPDWWVMESWLQQLNRVRNVIAHHGRLWNLGLGSPRMPATGQIPDFDNLIALPGVHTRIYAICCILCYLTRIINPQSSWIGELKSLIEAFPDIPHVGIHNMGFPADWKDHAFWV